MGFMQLENPEYFGKQHKNAYKYQFTNCSVSQKVVFMIIKAETSSKEDNLIGLSFKT